MGQSFYTSFGKQLLDSILAGILLVVLSPLLIVTGLVLRVAQGAPIFFRQQRPGYKAEPFVILKFRSMNELRDSNGQLLEDSQRLTSVGRVVRALSLDELLQLINVLKGDMSLVGPRPLLMEYVPLYNDRQALRHNVKPGITGLAQINGRNATTWEKRLEWDVRYVETLSLGLDLKILLLTFLKVIKREGISSQSTATMEKFKGSPNP